MGNVAQIPDAGRYILSQRTILLRADENQLSNDYLRHYISSDEFQNLMRQQSSGTTATGIQRAKLEPLPISFPVSKSEQTEIARTLTAVDSAIERSAALIAKQRRMIVGFTQHLLTRGIDEGGHLRSEGTHEFTESPAGRIPKDWEVRSISSVLAAPPKNGFSPVEAGDWNGSYILGLGCLTPDGFQPKQLKFAPPATRASKAALLRPGDFLISRSNTRALVGLVGIYAEVGEPCVYPDLMVRLVFTKEVCSEFMEQVFMSRQMRRQIESAAIGTSGSMVKISAALIKSFVFVRPTLEEQRRILLRLKAIDAHFHTNLRSVKKLHSLKIALMQDLLTGKKRVKSDVEQVAAAALEPV